MKRKNDVENDERNQFQSTPKHVLASFTNKSNDKNMMIETTADASMINLPIESRQDEERKVVKRAKIIAVVIVDDDEK